MAPRRLLPLAALLALAVALALPVASAHVPQVSPDSRAFDGARSWAFYDELQPSETHRYTFTLAEGERLFLSIAVPRGAGAGWTPAATLAGPTGDLALERRDVVGYEPATPYAAREVWAYDAPAPATGLYEVTLSDTAGAGGRYALGYGLNEAFTPVEWVGIPLAAVRIHLWEGQPLALVLAPHVAALALLAVGRRTPFASRLLAALFLGTALAVGMQMALAIAAGASAPAWAWAFTGVVIALSAALALGAWRARRTWAFAGLGLAGLAAWSGLLLGPALALALAAIRGIRGVRGTRRASSPAQPREG